MRQEGRDGNREEPEARAQVQGSCGNTVFKIKI